MRLIVLIVSLVALNCSSAFAKGSIKMTWKDTEFYADFEQPWETDRGFQKRAEYQFNKYMKKLAKRLPEGQELQITVTDMDLAGRIVRKVGGEERTLRFEDIPKMSLTYKLKDSNGSIIKSGETDLADPNYRLVRAFSLTTTDRSFIFEKKMMKKWFEENFQSQI